MELFKTSDLNDLPPQTNEAFKDTVQQITPPSALNMRYRNMLNFPKYARRRSSAFDNRIKRTGMLLDPLATLAVLRKFLQPYINRDINAVISRYMDEFFSIAFKNIRSNLGESALADGDLRRLQYSIMKSAAAQFRPPSHQSNEQSSLHLNGDQHLNSQSAPSRVIPTPMVLESHRSLRRSAPLRKTVPLEHDSGQAVKDEEDASAVAKDYTRSELSELLPSGPPNGGLPPPSLEFSLLPPPLPPAVGSAVPARKSKRLASQVPPPPPSVVPAAASLLNGDLQTDRFGHHHLNPLSCGSNVGAPSSMSVSSRSPSTGPPSQLGLQSTVEGDEDDVATSPSPPSSPESGFSIAKPEVPTVTVAPPRATKRTYQRSFRQYNSYSGGGTGKRRLGNSERFSHPADPYALPSELEEGNNHFEKPASLSPSVRESLGGTDTSRGHSPADGSAEPKVALPHPPPPLSAATSSITNEDTFVLGSVANAWLGLGAARGRIYTKHPWLFRYLCDVTDRVWLAQAGHLPNCGIKAFLMLTRQVRMLGERQKPDISEKQGALVGFSLPPWLLKKVLHSANPSAHPAPPQAPSRNSPRPPSVKVDAGVSPNSSSHQRPPNEPVLVNHVTVFQAPSSTATAYRPYSTVAATSDITDAGGGGGGGSRRRDDVDGPCAVDEHFDVDRQLFRLRRTGDATTTNTWHAVNGDDGGGGPKYALRKTVETADLSQTTTNTDVPSYFDANGASAPKLSRIPTKVYDGRRQLSISSASTSSPFSCDLREVGQPAVSSMNSSLSPPKLNAMEGLGGGDAGGGPSTTLPCNSSH
nr:unnamed protein product [Spirometra erinaceieuropaei]